MSPDCTGEPDSVSVAPIFIIGNGKEKEGTSTSKVDISKGTISNVESIVKQYKLGEDYVSDSASPGLVSYWEFDDGVTDSYGDNHGTLVGGNTDGGILNLNGVGDYITTNSIDLTPYSEGTISLWFKTPLLHNGDLFNWRETAWQNTINLIVKSNGKLALELHTDSINVINIENDGFYSPNNWHHIVITQDGIISKMYIDEVLQTTNGGGEWFDDLIYSNQGITIGKSNAAGWFSGSIDNIRIYNRALSEDEIQEIYRQESGYDEIVDSAVSWWKFDGDFTDGNGNNHGTAFNQSNTGGNVLNLDGNGDGVSLANQDIDSNWAVSLWAKGNVDSPGGPTGSMIFGDRDVSYFFYMWDGDKTKFSSNGDIWWTSDTDFYNKWRYVTLVADDTGVELFLDGVSQGRQNGNTLLKPYYFGTGHEVANYDFNGALDDIMIFDKVLTQDQINAIYNNQKKS